MGILDEANFDNSDETKPTTEAETPKPKGKRKMLLSLLGVILLIAAAVGGSIYIVKQKPEILGLSKNANIQDQKEIEKIVAEVGKLMLLPDETPTLATVSNLSEVSDQAFFKNAKEGDKVLVYRNAKKAILYRPSENKIIEVGVVNISEETAPQDDQLDVELLPSLSPAAPSPTESLPAASPTFAPTPSVPSPTPRPSGAGSATPSN